MNLTRELSQILTRVLSVENSILQRLLVVRRMEQEEEEVYFNRGEKSKLRKLNLLEKWPYERKPAKVQPPEAPGPPKQRPKERKKPERK